MRASGPLGGVNSRRAMVISPLPRWACHGCAKPTQRRQAIYLPLAVAKALWTARGSDVVGVIQFDWVWLSTDAQVSALVDSYRSASLGTKLLGRYNFRNDAAHIRGFLIPCARIPLIFVAEGALTLTEHRVAFAGRRRRVFGWRVVGVRSDLSFEFAANEIIAAEVADVPSPVARFFNIPFTRIRTVREAPFDNFLLCVGGRVSMPRIRAQSLELRHALQAMATKSTG